MVQEGDSVLIGAPGPENYPEQSGIGILREAGAGLAPDVHGNVGARWNMAGKGTEETIH